MLRTELRTAALVRVNRFAASVREDPLRDAWPSKVSDAAAQLIGAWRRCEYAIDRSSERKRIVGAHACRGLERSESANG